MVLKFCVRKDCPKNLVTMNIPEPMIDQAQPLLKPQEDDVEFQNERDETEGGIRSMAIGQGIHNPRQLKSFGIMISALRVFGSDTKLMLLMILSIIPFFVFMVFYEIELQKVILAASSVLITPDFITVTSRASSIPKVDHDNNMAEFLYDVLQLCLLYLFLYPLLELVSMTTTIQIAAKVHAGENPASLKEVFYRENNLKCLLSTYSYVHLLSYLTLLGLSLIYVTHLIFTSMVSFHDFWLLDISIWVFILLIGVHTMFFVAVLYKYLNWSAFWNMAVVISVLEEETELDTYEMAMYYGKHSKKTGFQLILVFVGFSIILRLPCLYVYGGLSSWGIVGVTSAVIGLVCLGNLVKWISFVLYYFDCKQQTMEKKNDEEIGKAVNVG